jgi:hypothetical protein
MFWRRRPDKAKRAGSGAEVFNDLRSRLLTLDPSSIGVAPGADLPRVFGVVMDMSYPNGSATLVAIADRTTSLYTSSGGGVIGGGYHEPVAQANRRLLMVAEAHLEHFERRDPAGLPAVGRVQITALTYSGRLSLDAPEDDLGHRGHPAAPVFHAAHDVITALREVEEGANSASTATEQPTGGATPLMAAAHGGDPEAVTRLIEQGIPIEDHDDSGYTALMYAANAGQDEAVRVLLAHGADPNAADGQMSTPLMFAAQHDHVDIVRQLLTAGADPNAHGSHGLTALGFARQNGHRRTEAALTSAGARE